MTRCERGNWIDAEGHIRAVPPPRSHYDIIIGNMDLAPLQDYCEGARADSVPCTIHPRKPPRAHLAIITGAPNVAKEIQLTRQYIRTQTRLNQIQRFETIIKAPRKRRPLPEIRTAREILAKSKR